MSGGHSTKIDCVAWSPVHKDVLASASCDDKRISIWDARRESGGVSPDVLTMTSSFDIQWLKWCKASQWTLPQSTSSSPLMGKS